MGSCAVETQTAQFTITTIAQAVIGSGSIVDLKARERGHGNPDSRMTCRPGLS